jgi:UMF1 family MFS transporter
MQTSPMANDPREIFGWTMYDWASSAFSTTVITVLFGPYLTGVAQDAVGANGIVLRLGPLGSLTAKSLYPSCIAVSVVIQALLLPILGAIGDATALKKRMMAIGCYLGAAATCLLFFVTPERYLLGGVLLIVANVALGASVVLYNAFLNEIATSDLRDEVSSRGYALGYLGGGLLLGANLALVSMAGRLGISTALAIRLSLLSAGLWWGGFAVITFRRLRDRPAATSTPRGSYLRLGVAELAQTIRALGHLRQMRRYLLAFMAFNDGIQTVITVASVFLAQELFVARGQATDQAFLIELTLMIQFVAFFGAILFGRIARWAGTKNAILASLVVWTGIVVYTYAALQTVGQAWAMGAVLGIVLGGSQALSRSLFSRMIPHGREAAFFGLYEISDRGTSWIGPAIFAVVVAATNSYRQAILSLIALFLAGIVVLFFTDTDRAIAEGLGPSEKPVSARA